MQAMPENTDRQAETENAPVPVPCGLGRRILVMFYDAIAIVALMMAVTALSLLTPLREQMVLLDPIPTVLMALTWFLYLAWCWRRNGLTLGMRAWRVQLIFDDGKRPGWGRCLLRFVVSLASATLLGMGFIWCLLNPQRRSWHDLVSGSYLIRQQT